MLFPTYFSVMLGLFPTYFSVMLAVKIIKIRLIAI